MNIFNKIKSGATSLFGKNKGGDRLFSKKVSLYDAIHSSYHPEEEKQNLANKGYVYDKDLSNHNQSVYYNPNENKLMYNVAGTHNMNDWGTNAMLAIG